MTLNVMTTQEKLDEIERLIRDLRGVPGPGVDALKAVAADLRARLAFAPSAAFVDLDRRVVALARSRTHLGYSQHALRFLAEGVVTNWPVIKQALEKFGESVDA